MQSGNLLDALNSTSSLRSSIGSSSGLDHLNLHSEVRAVNSAGPLGSSGSFSGTDLNGSQQLLSGPRLVQDLSDHLNSLSSSDERKKLISSLLQLIDDDCLVLLGNRLEAEKKGRRKGNKNKDSKDNNNSLKNKKGDKNNKDPDVNSNGNNSIGSSSMEAIPESSGSQLQSTSSLPQTSPTTGSRKTFAGFLRREKKDKDKKVSKASKKDLLNGSNGKSGTSSAGGSPKDTLTMRQTSHTSSLMGDISSLEGNRDSTSATDVKMDEEGYIIPPHHNIPDNSSDARTSSKRKELDRFYSDSDSSDDEEEVKKPIHVIIKPINGTQGLKTTGSIAELKETVKGLSISPSLLPSKLRHEAKVKRRQVTIAGDSVTASSDDGRLQRSFSQHLYRPENESSSTSSWFNSNSNSTTANNSNSSSNISNPHNSNNSWATSFADTTVNSQASEDRYAALSSLFAEVNNSNCLGNSIMNNGVMSRQDAGISSTAAGSGVGSAANALLSNQFNSVNNTNNSLAKSMSSSSVMGPPALPSLARPPSKKSSLVNNNSNGQPLTSLASSLNSSSISNALVNSNNAWSPAYHTVLANANNMTRCKSYGSLSSSSDMRMTPVSITSMGSSRGPSPLTIGFNDTVPLAVAIQESISAKFKGTDESRCDVQMLGSLKIAFPAGIVQVLMNNPNPSSLTFKVKNSSRIERFYPNKAILVLPNEPYLPEQEEYLFEVNSVGLVTHLKKSFEQTPNARYFYLDILKYQVKGCPGAKSCPLQVVSHWKCDPHSTGLKVEYKYNPSALSTVEPLTNVSFGVFIDAEVTDVQGKPQPSWNPQTKQAFWNFSTISQSSEDSGLGSLRAKFDVTNGPCSPSAVTVNFTVSEATLSGIEFELISSGYRVSLVKKQVIASRFSSEADSVISYAGV